MLRCHRYYNDRFPGKPTNLFNSKGCQNTAPLQRETEDNKDSVGTTRSSRLSTPPVWKRASQKSQPIKSEKNGTQYMIPRLQNTFYFLDS